MMQITDYEQEYWVAHINWNICLLRWLKDLTVLEMITDDNCRQPSSCWTLKNRSSTGWWFTLNCNGWG